MEIQTATNHIEIEARKLKAPIIITLILMLAIMFVFAYTLGYSQAINFCAEQAVKVLNINVSISDYGVKLIETGITKGIIR